MRRCRTSLLIHLAGCCLAAFLSPAQPFTNNPGLVSPPSAVNQVVDPDRSPTVDAWVWANVRRPPGRNLSPEARQRIEGFRNAARTYLQQQEALRRRLQGATDDDRARIRAQLETLHHQWVERAREFRKEFKDRQAELIPKLEGHRSLLQEENRALLRDQLKDSLKESSPPRRDR